MASILLVDDEDSADATAVRLNQGGWKAVAVRSGELAIEKLHQEPFDAVVLDRNMPGLKGDEVLRRIYANPQMRHLCVVMLTGFGDVPNAVESLKVGAWQYLQKPVSVADLRSVLMAGIAVKRCHEIRAELLATNNREEMVRRVEEVAVTVGGADGLNIVFVPEQGNPIDILGKTPEEPFERQFWKEVMKGTPFLWAETEDETKRLQPLSRDTKSMIAVPVHADGGKIIGVLDVESTRERFFALGWKDTVYYLSDLISLGLALEDAQRQKVEHQVAQDKIKQLAQLHDELSHSIGTYAQNISLAAAKLAETKGFNEDTSRRIEVIKRAADSVSVVIKRLQEAAEDFDVVRKPVEIVPMVRDAIEDYVDECRNKAIDLGYPPLVSASVPVDRELLTHALQCIFRNAIEAIEDRRSEDLSRKHQRDAINIGLEQTDDSVLISVQDTGIGFEPKMKEKIFEPLFTTKNPRERQNQGMGLFTVWRIVNGHGGSIDCDSNGLHSGARFTIRIPKKP